MHESASSGVKFNGSTSLQEFVSTEVTYSGGDMIIVLQEVLSNRLQFHNGTYSELPDSIKFILDNLQAAFTRNHRNLFQITLRALEIHLVNLIAQNEAYISHHDNLVPENDLALENNFVSENNLVSMNNLNNLVSENNFVSENNLVSENEALRSRLEANISQLFGKEEIHSMDKETIMSTNYTRLSLKTQSWLRCAIANLPTDIQSRILKSKAMFRSFDQWFKYFKKFVTTTIPNLDELDESDNVFIQLVWEKHFGSSLRVCEKKHPFLGLLIDYDDGSYVTDNDSDDDDRNPNWLSQMFEYGFIRFIKLRSHKQASQLPQIIQTSIKGFESSFIRYFVSIRC